MSGTTFDAGVKISLVETVSSGLAAMAKMFTRTQTAADALQARLNKIHSTFSSGAVMFAGGAALAAPLIAASKAASEYQHTLNQMRTAGFSNAEMAKSVGAAWQTSSKIITSSATENLKVIQDLRSVFGDVNESIAYMPKFAKIQGAYSSVLDNKLAGRANELTFSMAKALDMMGKVKNSAVFNASADAMFRATVATGGRVTPADYMTTLKYTRQAKFGLSDDFLYKKLPELILENKGGSGSSGGVGPQIAALYRFGVQGIMNKRSAAALQDLGMIPSSSILKTSTTGTTLKGGVLGSGLLARDPVDWVNKVFLPKLIAANHIKAGDTNAMVMASNQVFKGNQLAAGLVAEIIKKPFQFARFSGLYNKTQGVDGAYDSGQKNDPNANWMAFHASLHNLSTVIGNQILPVLTPLVNRLASSIQQVALFLHMHPKLTQTLTALTAAASGALMLGGAIQIARAGFMGLQLVFPVLTKFMGPLGIGIMAVTLAVQNWDKIMGFVHQNQRVFINIAAQAVLFGDALNTALSGLCKWFRELGIAIGNFVTSVANKLSNMPVLGGMMKGVATLAGDIGMKMANVFKVDDVTAKRNEKTLEKHHLGWLSDAIKGNAQVRMNDTTDFITKGLAHGNSGPKTIIDKRHITLTVNVEGAKGDPEKMAEKIADHTIKKLGKELSHKLGAGSGNSTGRTIFQHGNYRT